MARKSVERCSSSFLLGNVNCQKVLSPSPRLTAELCALLGKLPLRAELRLILPGFGQRGVVGCGLWGAAASWVRPGALLACLLRYMCPPSPGLLLPDRLAEVSTIA